ncbi:protein DMP3-like [Aegilops tauschii subsp. strangulata]|nr:protein DMP3-like [Aegilops tauschii subsp. strangulata]
MTNLPIREPPKTKVGGDSSSLYDKTLSTASNLARLLPTGTTTALQTLALSFTNHGDCLSVNRYFTWALILFLGVLCALLSFTDSVTDRHGHTRYGFVHPWGFTPFNSDDSDGGGAIPTGDSRRRRMR